GLLARCRLRAARVLPCAAAVAAAQAHAVALLRGMLPAGVLVQCLGMRGAGICGCAPGDAAAAIDGGWERIVRRCVRRAPRGPGLERPALPLPAGAGKGFSGQAFFLAAFLAGAFFFAGADFAAAFFGAAFFAAAFFFGAAFFAGFS